MAETADASLDDEQFKNDLVAVLPHLRAFARGLCGRSDYADDLVQESAIKAWNARSRFEAGTNLRAWIFTILRNHYLSELRRNRRQSDIDDEVHEKLLVMDPDQEDTVHLADMQKALNKLPSERREAILLVGASGFTYEEAAEICGCAIGTVKSRVARARTDLARLLDNDPSDR